MKIAFNRKLCWAAGLAAVLMIFVAFNGAVDATMSSEQCLSCHGKLSSSKLVIPNEFMQSVHGSISCDACHLKMNTLPHDGKAIDALQACVACHSNISREYSSSVHGKLFAQGNEKLGCTGCHGKTHAIVPSSNPDSPVTNLNVVETCSGCHEGYVVESYLHSFHGIANKFGSESVAQCVSCHGSHDILGPNDPASAVAKENVPEGCAKCHGGKALANFAEGPEHFSEEPGGSGAPMYWTFKFFIWLTIITISLLIIHIELELFRRLKEK